MPHSTTSRDPSASRATPKPAPDRDGDSGLEKFPDHIDAPMYASNGWRDPSPGRGYANGMNGGTQPVVERWQPRKESNQARGVRWGQMEPPAGPPLGNGHGHGRGHSRQKSITEAFRTIRDRNGSVTQNAHEIADALKAPISAKLIVCHFIP